MVFRAFAVAIMVSVLALWGVGAAAGAPRSASAASRASGPLVQTDKGPVIGFAKNGVDEFLGIPYAAPPVGPLRWRPPQQHAPWTQPLQATHYGPRCAQSTTFGVFAEPSVSEDCLYLNVFTPDIGRLGSKGLPVFVWIHGGGNIDGESDDYDGSKLATGALYGGSDTVVVTINYRLGLLGFLANPALDSEGHLFGDYGIMDQQAALRWVQHNIAAFGGNPHNVTVGGQSSGAQDTQANVISPESAGLFQHAIAQSSFTMVQTPLPTALSAGEAFANAAGCPGTGPTAAACLRALPVPEILQLEGTLNAAGPYFPSDEIIVGPGTVVPIEPQQAWRSGQYNHMPMMGGDTADEGNFGIGILEYFSTPQAPLTADQYYAAIEETYRPPAYPAGTAAKVLAQYPLSAYPTPQLAYDAVRTASTIHQAVCVDLDAANLLAQRIPVYAYMFNDQNAPYYFPPMPGFEPLAAHTSDIQFLFPNYHGGILGVSHPLNAQEATLSNELVAAWTNFALTGNPNRTGSSPWPRYSTNPDAASILSEDVPGLSTMTSAQLSARYHCAFWDSVSNY
jgi:para-nitrobenzyl esterase